MGALVDAVQIEERSMDGVTGRKVSMSAVPDGSGRTDRSNVVITSHLDVVRAEKVVVARFSGDCWYGGLVEDS